MKVYLLILFMVLCLSSLMSMLVILASVQLKFLQIASEHIQVTYFMPVILLAYCYLDIRKRNRTLHGYLTWILAPIFLWRVRGILKSHGVFYVVCWYTLLLNSLGCFCHFWHIIWVFYSLVECFYIYYLFAN